jgi:hypothetical protein
LTIGDSNGGGDDRIKKNNIQFKKVAGKNHIDFPDTYFELKKDFSQKSLMMFI